MEATQKKYRPQIKSKWKVNLSYSQNHVPLLSQANSLLLQGAVICHFLWLTFFDILGLVIYLFFSYHI